ERREDEMGRPVGPRRWEGARRSCHAQALRAVGEPGRPPGARPRPWAARCAQGPRGEVPRRPSAISAKGVRTRRGPAFGRTRTSTRLARELLVAGTDAITEFSTTCGDGTLDPGEQSRERDARQDHLGAQGVGRLWIAAREVRAREATTRFCAARSP